MIRFLAPFLVASTFAAGTIGTAHAGTVCVVDAEMAINETSEGKAAKKRLEGMYAAKQTELEADQAAFEKAIQSFESSKMILSDDARRAKEEELMKTQQQLQQKLMMAEQEMQATYGQLLQDMEGKLYKIAGTVGAAKGCAMLMQKAALLWSDDSVKDVTKDVIAALDAAK